MKLFILPIPLPIPAPVFAVAYVAYSWYAKGGGRFSSGMAGQKINHDAHLIGALVGLLFVLVTDPGAYAPIAAHCPRLNARNRELRRRASRDLDCGIAGGPV